MNNMQKTRIFEMLRHRGYLSSLTQRMVEKFVDRWNVSPFSAAIETHVIEETRMAEILAEEFKMPRLMRVRSLQVRPEVFSCIPYDTALDLVVFPFELTESGRLHVVFADPSIQGIVTKLESDSKKLIEPFIGERSEIIAAIQRHYPLSLQLPTLLSSVNR